MGPIPLTPYDLGLAAVLVLLLSATSYYARLAISQPLLLGGLCPAPPLRADRRRARSLVCVESGSAGLS